MDTKVLSGIPPLPYKFILYIIVICVIVGLLVQFMVSTPQFTNVYEGFGGIARGSGKPDSLRTLPEGSEILDVLSSTDKSADYRELQLILSKLGSLKKDLMSPSGIIEATRYLAFETAHDRINVAEVCGMCLNQTIPSRDLDIIFTTWRDRSKKLITKLSTDANLTESDVVKLEKKFNYIFDDVYAISKSRCLKTLPAQDKGDVGGYTPESLKDLRTYDNNYDGLSASGWNGAV